MAVDSKVGRPDWDAATSGPAAKVLRTKWTVFADEEPGHPGSRILETANTEAVAWRLAREKAIRGYIVRTIRWNGAVLYSEPEIRDHLERAD